MTWHPDMPLEYRNAIVTGDARELAKRIPDESVDLVFTDPVYERIEDYTWLAEESCRVLKPSGALLAFCGIGWLEATMAALRKAGRSVRWVFPVYQPGQTQRIHPKVFNHWYCLLWAGGEPRATLADVQMSRMASLSGSHAWRKNPVPLRAYASAFSRVGDVIWDPFTGGGTIPVICQQTGRNYVASELDCEAALLARERVRLAPLPLFVADPLPAPCFDFAEGATA